VGVFRADFVVEGRVVVELKAGRALDESAHAQLLDDLSCSDIEIGLLLHFGPKPRFHRAIYTINRERRPAPR
jgi:GxxExxY protein